MTHWKNTTGGGCLSQNNLRRRSSRKLRLTVFAALVAVAAAIAVPVAANADVRNGVVQLLSPITQFFAGDDGAQTRAADGTHVSDGMTINDWQNYMGESVSMGTANVGRIWTDKSVSTGNIELNPNGGTVTKSESSDFLVALSALSSTSNKVTYTDKPLDIVLVLDTSGSMAYRMPVYDDGTLDHNATYYTDSGEDSNSTPPYYGNEVEWNEQRQEWGYYGAWTWNTVTPKTSSSDNDRYHTQLYGPTRLSALQDAVNGFIDSTAESNEDANADTRHRVSIVTFESSADTDRALTDCYGNNVTTLKNTVNGLRANGGTRADLGLEQAQSALSGQGSRSNAQKVVIFFTDGQPGLYRFEDAIAGEAINEARDMKADDVTIYSIGVVEGANPDNTTSDINRYLHAISSNYPEASCPVSYMSWASGSSWGGYDFTWGNYGDFGQLDLGTPASGEEGEPAPEYYFAAEDAEGLSDVFAQIAQDMEPSSAGVPTEVESGFNMDASGYITFTDTLGAYMEVDSQQDVTVVYKNTAYKAEYSDGSYALPNQLVEGNYVAQNGQSLSNINQIVFEVQKSENYALQGDTVTLKIPASLIPLLHYNVNTENGQTTITNDANETFPIRALYGVKLIDGMNEKLASPDSALSSYLANNSTEDGAQAYFYSNDWQRSSQGVQTELGSTTASFNPSQNNAFYYFQEDTPVYTNAECTDPATQEDLRGGGSLYYKFTYDMPGNNEDNWYAIEVDKANFANHVGYYGINTWNDHSDNTDIEIGQVYIRDGAPRLSRTNDFDTPKAENVTGTATQALYPSWTSTSSADTVNVALGNNGRIAVELPGSLSITKTVVTPEGFPADDANYHKSVDFEFTIHVDGATSADGAYAAAVVENGTTRQVNGGITFDDSGNSTFKLHDGQGLIIYGISNGATYSVSEAAQTGYTTTKTGDTGTITAGDTSEAVFTNTYSINTPAKVSGSADLTGTKTVDGRAWEADESYVFYLQPLAAGNPMPADANNNRAEATVTGDPDRGEDSISFNFGDIEFNTPGVYTYTIQEDATKSSDMPGVTLSQAAYRVQITVEDNRDGSLTAIVKIFQSRTDDNVEIEEEDWVEADTAAFVNTYKVGAAAAGVYVDKAIVDEAESNMTVENGDYRFILEPAGDNAASAPMPNGSTGEGASRQALSTNQGNRASFSIPFTNDDFPEGENEATFWYKLTEDDAYEVIPGMEYSTQVFYAKVTFERTQDADGNALIRPTVAYYTELNGTEVTADGQALFTNTFDPADVTATGSTAIHGTKTVDGRDWNGDSYTFTIAQDADHPNQGGVTMPADCTAKVTDDVEGEAKVDGAAYPFAFDGVTFSKVGTYYFTITETGTPAVDSGMTYDSHETNVAVTVGVDAEGGCLEITNVTYENEGVTGASAEQAEYTNTYRAAFDYGDGEKGGIQVNKSLSGRTLRAGEFSFVVKGIDGVGTTADEANALLANSDRLFGNNADGSMRLFQGDGFQFDQDDAGKTFSFVVDELNTQDEITAADSRQTLKPNVTYDTASYRVDLTVIDDGDGSMHVETSITACDAAGAKIGDPVYSGSTEDADYTVPTVKFSNSYAPDKAEYDTTTAAVLNKVIDGRAWLESDEFTFTIAADTSLEGNLAAEAMPQGITATLSGDDHAGTADGSKVPFGFGVLTFEKPGTYQYVVTEGGAGTESNGLTYASNTAVLKFVVEDNPGTGDLVISNTDIVTNGAFTNTYKASVDYSTVGGLNIVKTLENHALSEGQFTFTAQEIDENGDSVGEAVEWKNSVPTLGNNVAVWNPLSDLEFTLDDAGKTLRFTVSEKNSGADGYTYDDAVYTVEITPVDNQDGTMSVHTLVTKKGVDEPIFDKTTSAVSFETAVLAFTNSYGDDATTGDVAADVDATKTLSGRDMTADEFGFEIVTRGADTNDGAEFNSEKVATGTNAAAEDDTAGDVTFTGTNGAMTYTLAKLDAAVDAGYATKDATGDNTVWTLYYTARELTNALPDNVTAVDGSTSFDFTVTVTDNNDGTLSAKVNAPEGGIVFKNVFTKPVVVGGEAGVKVQKTFTGREDDAWLDTDSFEFTIAAVTEGAPMPDPATTTVSNKSDAVDGVTGAYSSVFGNITFNKTDLDGEGSKVFEYTITETAPADNGNGITKDTHVAKVIITVTDNGTDLSADVAYDNSGATTDADKAVTNAAAFTNTYEATGETTVNTKAQFELQKQLINTPWDGQEFTFNISGVDGDKNAAPLPVKGDAEVSSVTVNGPDSEGGNTAALDFGTITFTKPGTYTYTVSEELPDGVADADPVANGIRYDTTDIVVTVTVEDDNSGGLTSEVSFMEGEDKTFTNVYESGLDYGAAGGLQIVKNLFGHDINADDFTFIVTPEDRESADLLGMTEWTDGEAEEVSVTAAQLSANEEGEYVATATMKLFNGVKFDLSNNGDEYGYTITERPNVTDAAYKNDTTKYQVTISVSDEGDGVMKVTTTVTPEGGDPIDYVYTSDATSDAAQVTFNNRYDVEGALGGEGNIAIVAHKTLNNAELEGNDFEFKVVGTKANGETQVEATGSNDVDGNITFTPIEYDSDKLAADVASGVAEVDDQGDTEVYTYAYVVRETGLPTGVTANVASFPITVTVTDDHSGVLAVEVVYDATDPNVDSLEFVNTYGDAEGTPIKVGGKKELKPSSEGGSTPSLEDIAGKFTFTLTGEVVDENGDTVEGEKAVMPDETKTKNDANGDVDFGNIEFTMENVFGSSATDEGTEPGEGEVPGEDVETPTEPDQGDETENQGGSTTVDTPEGESVTDGVETVPSEGDESTDVDQPAATDPSASEEADTETTEEGSSQNDVAMLAAENGDEATGDPEPESLGQPRNKIFKYTVTETGTVDGITNGVDQVFYAIVTDDGQGNLSVVWSSDLAGEHQLVAGAQFTIVNTYGSKSEPTEPTDGQITIFKDFQGEGAQLKGGDFNFTITAAGDYGDKVSPATLNGTNDAQGNVTFDGGFVFTAAGTYSFVIDEIEGTDQNVTYDKNTYTVTAKVTDNGDGTLSVEWSLVGEPASEQYDIVFTNVYDEPYIPPTPDPDPSDPSKPDIDVDKKLDGRDIVAGEFSFKIAATGDNADYVTPKALTGTVDASGNVSFPGKGFVFDKTGEYEFTVSEFLPGDDDPETPGVQHNGVTYDETTYTITAKVTKGAGNKLVVSWDLGAVAPGVTFHNEYEPDETAKVTVNATKVLIGRDLAAGEFIFELVDAQGNVVGTATNNADGSVSFSPLEFTEAGTYTYTLREVTGGLANVTYDTTVHTVTITVVDNGDGTLTATVTYDSGSGAAPVFTNTYKVPDQPGKPEEPSEPERPDTPKIPDAGDHTNVALPAFLAVGGAALIACACLLKLRKSR